jgi:hypothetical protein
MSPLRGRRGPIRAQSLHNQRDECRPQRGPERRLGVSERRAALGQSNRDVGAQGKSFGAINARNKASFKSKY